MQIIRIHQLMGLLGVSRTTIWRWEREQAEFPKRLRLSSSVVCWSLDEVNAWLASRPRGMAVARYESSRASGPQARSGKAA